MANLITNESAYLAPIEYSDQGTAEQAQIDALIISVSEYIEKYCNRIFLSATYTDELYDGDGWDFLFIKNSPLISLTDIDILDQGITVATVTYAASNFVLTLPTGEITWKPATFLNEGGVFPVGKQNIQVTYVGGFAAVPTTIQQVAAEMVIEQFDPTLSVDGIEKEKIGDYFYSKGKDFRQSLTASTLQKLNQYKIRKV